MKELNQLIQEIIDFGDVIKYTDDHDDPNFKHACDLFMQYLDWRFDELNQKLQSEDQVCASCLNKKELDHLSRLITSPSRVTETRLAWAQNLFDFCVDLSEAHSIAA